MWRRNKFSVAIVNYHLCCQEYDSTSPLNNIFKSLPCRVCRQSSGTHKGMYNLQRTTLTFWLPLHLSPHTKEQGAAKEHIFLAIKCNTRIFPTIKTRSSKSGERICERKCGFPLAVRYQPIQSENSITQSMCIPISSGTPSPLNLCHRNPTFGFRFLGWSVMCD
jgi:hypothetical protein